MGLDIFISTDKDVERRDDKRNSLSRLFVTLILQQHDNNDEEIDQISKISGVDLTPLLEMEIPDMSHLEFQIYYNDDEEELRSMKEEIAQVKEYYSKNINLVVETLQSLDRILKATPEYYKQLKLTDADENYIDYFKNYSVDVEPNEYGFVSDSDTNFGVDIRTLLSYLIYAKSQGAKKTFFTFG